MDFELKIIDIIQMKKSQPRSLIQLMNNRLQSKYQTILSFYEAKSINQILSMSPHCTTFMDFCDLRILSEELEYLKRVYYHRTLTGKPEIQQRMKVICQHYVTNPALSTFTYQYPMMIITNTKSLFIKRKRRLRKIQAGQGSSDFTEQREQQYLQFQSKSQNFLDDLQNSGISEQNYQSESSVSFESDAYNIYVDEQFENRQGIEKIKLNLSEECIKHLVDDYTNLNQVDRRNIYPQGGSLHSVFLNKLAFTNIQNQQKLQKESNISVVPIQQKPWLEKKEKKSSILGDLITQILQRPINFSHLGLSRDNNTNQYKNLGFHSEQKSISKQKQQRANKRQKIRQKAEQLLRKVRNSTEKQSSKNKNDNFY